MLEIAECDEAGNVTATYVQSTVDQDNTSRIDVIVRLRSKCEIVAALTLALSCQRIRNRNGRRCWTFFCQPATLTL